MTKPVEKSRPGEIVDRCRVGRTGSGIDPQFLGQNRRKRTTTPTPVERCGHSKQRCETLVLPPVVAGYINDCTISTDLFRRADGVLGIIIKSSLERVWADHCPNRARLAE